MRAAFHSQLKSAIAPCTRWAIVLVIGICSLISPSVEAAQLSQTPIPVDNDGSHELFDFQQGRQGVWGATTPSPNKCPGARLSERRVLETGLGQGNMSLEATYDLPQLSPECWAGVWLKFDSFDLSDFDALSFEIKGVADNRYPRIIRVELKQKIDLADHPYALRVFEVHGISDQWQRFQIPLSDFVPFLEEPDLEDWTDIDEIVFVVESQFSSGGTFHLDNISVDASVASTSQQLPSLVIAHFEPEYAMDADSGTQDNTVTYENVVDAVSKSTVARLSYRTASDWATVTIDLEGIDASAYEALTFSARPETGRGPDAAQQFEVYVFSGESVGGGLADTPPHVRSVVRLEDDGWRKYALPFDHFSSKGNDDGFWANITELVFAFHPNVSGESGVIYLDNIQFELLSTQASHAAGAPPTVASNADEAAARVEGKEAVPSTEEEAATSMDGQEDVAHLEVDDSVRAEPDETRTDLSDESVVSGEPPLENGSARLLVPDPEFCEANNSGVAFAPPSRVVDSYPTVDGRGCILKIEVDTLTWGAYWFELGPADLSRFGTLVFDMYMETDNPETRLTIELKRSPVHLSIYGVDDPPTAWQTISIPLTHFYPASYGSPLTTFEVVAELVFTVVPPQGVRTQTTLYLDNIHFSE